MSNILIVHHTDADGHCAAALAKYELATDFDTVSFFEYDYSPEIDIEIPENTIVYLVDIGMDVTVDKFINDCLAEDKKNDIIHIDHHKTSVEYYKNNPNVGWKYFVHDETDERGPISGCLLTYIYSCMHNDERQNPMDMPFDMTETRSHVRFNDDPEREYRIPFIVRLIDDHDVFLHNLKESRPFSYAYKNSESSMVDPTNEDFWEIIYNDNHYMLHEMVCHGDTLIKEEARRNDKLREIGAFTTDIFDGYSCLCLNNLNHGSDMFGKEYEKYDMVCRFAYNGKNWSYSLYSAHTDRVDVSTFCKNFGGGGHRGAGGFIIDYCLFGNNAAPIKTKKGLWSGIKDFIKYIFS